MRVHVPQLRTFLRALCMHALPGDDASPGTPTVFTLASNFVPFPSLSLSLFVPLFPFHFFPSLSLLDSNSTFILRVQDDVLLRDCTCACLSLFSRVEKAGVLVSGRFFFPFFIKLKQKALGRHVFFLMLNTFYSQRASSFSLFYFYFYVSRVLRRVFILYDRTSFVVFRIENKGGDALKSFYEFLL